MSEYDIRWFRETDVEAFLILFEQVLGADQGRDWFDWKYADNPFVDHVPIVVAERDGRLVGARAFFALRMAVDGRQYDALQPCDTMVSADHRREGLFTRMTERAIDRYRDGDPAFFFNFPNHLSLPGNLKLGWQTVGKLHSHYRVAAPARLVTDRTESSGVRLAGRALSPMQTAFNAFRDAARSTPADVSVHRVTGVPADTLASIYRDATPAGIHAVRDETFYRWRFGHPNYEYTTYIAGGDDAASAMVVGLTGDAVTTVKISDVVPPTSAGATPTRLAILDRIVSDYPEAALFSAPSGAIPSSVLRRTGFVGDDTFPLSRVGSARTHVVRSLNGWELNGRDLREPDNWTATFAEVDGG